MNASPSRRRRRAATGLAAVALLGVSMTACAAGDDDVDAAAASEVTAEAGTQDTIVSSSDEGPRFSENGGPTMAGGPGAVGGVGGTVTAIDGSTLTVESQGRDGTTTSLTVETDGDTVVTTSTVGTVDDLAVGDTIVAFGETTDDEFVATALTEGTGPMGGPEFQAGGPGGEPPVFADGQTPPEFPDGATPPDGSLPEGGPPGRATQRMAGQVVAGTITEVGESTITVESDDGVETVITLDDTTTVTVSDELELGDIGVGSTIRVSGENVDDTVDATSIVVTDG